MENLGKEFTCSICTEVLYQPLILLDCLHSFCGSCLKEWFSWQLAAQQRNGGSGSPDALPYTCPACREAVRETRPNFTVNTLLEMFLKANPDKRKTDEEMGDIANRYKPGEVVLVRPEVKRKSGRELREEENERRLLRDVQDMSLREVGVGAEETSEERRERRRRERHSRDGRGEDGERRRRDTGSDHHSRTNSNTLQAESEGSEQRRRRRSRSAADSRRREEEQAHALRQVEHQSSLRSLISNSDIDSREMEEEILRQIREEGLLDGIDLENLDVNQEDQISERIAEAFRRRQNERARQEASRRNDMNRNTRPPSSRATSRDDSHDRATTTTRRGHSRSSSHVSQGEDSRPPPSRSSGHGAHLDIHNDETRHRRRTTSGSRSTTAPVPISTSASRPASRSQTDLSERPRSSSHVVTGTSRSSTDPSQRTSDSAIASAGLSRDPQSQSPQNSSPKLRSSSFSISSISPAATPAEPSRSDPVRPDSSRQKTRRPPPADIQVTAASTSQLSVDQTLYPAPLSPHSPLLPGDDAFSPSTNPQNTNRNSLIERASAMSSASRPTSSSSNMTARSRTQLYPEPSLICERCKKTHIEYELHYNCGICRHGEYNICLSCYRSGAGCLHWFGFGYGAWAKWEKLSATGQLPANAESPHMLTANRYIAPKIAPGGADGRRTLTTDDPMKRLQSGAFCANCLAWANECYWRCDSCNEGDWGFCNNCVNQGNSCTHSLLPLTYQPSDNSQQPLSPTHGQQLPSSAKILTGPGVMDVGSFKPLTFSTTCDICHHQIQPTSARYHCFECKSAVPGTQPGDYDICTSCYPNLVSTRKISPENAMHGWRRCLQGHRMVLVGFEEHRGGQRRSIIQEQVGGRSLQTNTTKDSGLLKWTWDESRVRLVTTEVSKTAPTSMPNGLGPADIVLEKSFPPDGGVGNSAVALWSWMPATDGAEDELMFPKGAEVQECKDVNGDWFQGVYLGKRGLFPGPYVRITAG